MAESSTAQKVIAASVLTLVVVFACKETSFLNCSNRYFITTVGLIAGLPTPFPSHETSFYPDTAAFVDGDIAWMIVATVFGLFLSPALVYLYS